MKNLKKVKKRNQMMIMKRDRAKSHKNQKKIYKFKKIYIKKKQKKSKRKLIQKKKEQKEIKIIQLKR